MRNPVSSRHLLILIALSIVVLVVVKVSRNLPKTVSEDRPVTPGSSQSDLTLTDVSFTETEEGRPVWTLQASRASYLKSGMVADFLQPSVVFYDSEQLHSVRLESDTGTADLSTNGVSLSGNVRARLEEGGQFATESLTYHHAERMLSANGEVHFNYLDSRITGTGLEYFLDTRKLEIKSDVQAFIPVGAIKRREG